MAEDDLDNEMDEVERTIIMPAPGGRRRATRELPSPRPPPSQPAEEVWSLRTESTGKNPLVGAAATPFALVKQLRDLPWHNDVASLRVQVVDAIRKFDAQARSQGVSSEVVVTARYMLCSLLDETVLGTPWGNQSEWSNQSLLATIHKEAWGGEEFFRILKELSADPARNLDLLELAYVCLRLGFQGRYRVMDRGSALLGEIEHSLFRTIQTQRGQPNRELSPHWKGLVDHRPAIARFVPMWVVPVVLCAALIVTYLSFSWTLNQTSDAVFSELNQLGGEIPAFASRRQVQPKGSVAAGVLEPEPEVQDKQIRNSLKEELQRGLLEVKSDVNSVKIIVHNQGLFPPGRATVEQIYHPAIQKIGSVLKAEPGRILVIGHTDNTPLSFRLKMRFPSNFDLSLARAKAVATILREKVPGPGRIVAEGAADSQPIAPNNTKEGRTKNRRIEIKILKKRGGA